MAVYTEVLERASSRRFVARYDIGQAVSCKGIAEGVENSNYLLHTDRGSYILTLYEKRVAPADLPFFLGLMEHLAAKGIACPTPLHQRARLGARRAVRPAGGHHQLPRRHVAAPADAAPLPAAGRGAGAHASGGRGFPAAAPQRPVGRRLAAPLRGHAGARARGRSRAWPTSSRGELGDLRGELARGPRRRHRSMPTSSPTTSSSSATGSPGIIDFYFACTDFLRLRPGGLPQCLVLRAGPQLQRHQGAAA